MLRYADAGLVPGDPGRAETLIVSDIHLGLPASRPVELMEFMESWTYDRLILLGDVFDDMHLNNLCKEGHQLLDFWRRTARRSWCELVWINGNHDRRLEQAIEGLIGIKAREQFAWETGSRRFLALHGDRFDATVSRLQMIPTLLSNINGWCQRRLGFDPRWACCFDAIHDYFGDLARKMPREAAAWAHAHQCHAVICGHTHRADRQRVAGEEGTIEYVNAGAWLGRPGNFVTVTEGVAQLNTHP